MSDDYFDEYCSCGAKQGIMDGYYHCTPACLATYLKAHPEEDFDENDFANMMLNLLEQFHKFQIDGKHFGEPPYKYNTLGFAEWLEFDYFTPPTTGDKKHE